MSKICMQLCQVLSEEIYLILNVTVIVTIYISVEVEDPNGTMSMKSMII